MRHYLADLTGSTEVLGTLTASNIMYPSSDGTSNQVIKTDGSGRLTFTSTVDTASYVAVANIDGDITADSIAYSNITGVPSGIVSGSEQISTEISGAFTSTSSSLAGAIEDVIDGTTTVTSASYAESASYAVSSSVTNILASNVDELTVQVQNVSGGTLTLGTPVHITGVVGGIFQVIAADAAVEANMPAVGLLQTALPNNAVGNAIIGGKLDGVNTSTFTAGEPLWVASGGGLTQSKPGGVNYLQNIGVVGRANASGEIIVMGAGRSNDVPNLASGHIFYGNSITEQVPIADVITGSLPAGTISGSAQIAADISGSLGANSTLIRSLTAASISGSFNSVSASIASDIASISDTDVDVNTTNLNTRLGQLTGNTSIGGASSNITIPGNLTVQGTRTELQVSQLNVEDTLITVASGAANAAAADGAGLYIDGANESFTWDNGNSRFNVSDDFHAAGNITLTGTVDGRDINVDGTRLDGILSSTGSYLTAHPNISAATSVNNSGRTYIQDITLDSNGHITGITSATETVTNTNTFRTVTAGGNTLGASETLAFTAGTNVTITEAGGAVTINSTDTNTQLSTEAVQDIVGAMFTGNTETRISATYQDGDGTIDLVVTDQSYTLPAATSTTRGGIELGSDTEQTTAANAVTSTANRTYAVQTNGGGQAVVNVPWVDTNTDTNTFRTVTAGGNTLGASETLAFTAGTNVTITESGGAVTINATDTNTQLSTEAVQDIVGAMFTGNTETRISATYQDGDGTIDLVVTDQSYTLPEATATTRGGIELFSNTDQSVAANAVTATAGRTYGIQLNSAGQAVVNVPWVDTNTDTNTFRTVTAGGNTLGASETLAFTAGTNVTITESGGAVTISATDTNTQATRDSLGIDTNDNVAFEGLMVGQTTGATANTIRCTGDIVAYYSSDKQFKDNIKPLEGALDKVKQIRGVEFDWNDKQDVFEGHDIGVIAQEVEAVYPDLVHYREHSDSKAVDYVKLNAVLIEAVKELSAKVEELEKKLQ